MDDANGRSDDSTAKLIALRALVGFVASYDTMVQSPALYTTAASIVKYVPYTLELTCMLTTSHRLTRIVAVALFIELLLRRWRAFGTVAEAGSMPVACGSVRLAISPRLSSLR